MIDPNLIRWINASINDAFYVGKGGYILYIEGQEESEIKNPDGSDPESYAELHISVGPEINEVTNGCYEVDVILTVMCSTVFNADDYLIHKITGQFLGLMSGSILLYRRGDDDVFLGCLQPIGKAKVQPWGPVEINNSQGALRVKQQSVEQHFHASL